MDSQPIKPYPPLSDHQVRTLLLLMRRGVANGQIALHEQALDAAGVETEEGAIILAEEWVLEAAEITVTGEPARFGLHLYVPSADLDDLCGVED